MGGPDVPVWNAVTLPLVPAAAPIRPALIRLVLVVAAAFGALILVRFNGVLFTSIADVEESDFAHYYVGSHLLFHGEDPYDPAALADVSDADLGFDSPDPLGKRRVTNPAALLLVTLPLLALDVKGAFGVWVLSQIAAWLLSCRLAVRMFTPWRGWHSTAAVFLISLVAQSVYGNFLYGQVQPLVLLLSLAGWKLAARGSVWAQLAGAAVLGLGASLKLITWPLLVLVAVLAEPVATQSRRWRQVLGAPRVWAMWAAGGAAFLAPWVVTTAWVGAGSLRSFRSEALRYVNDSVFLYQGSYSPVGIAVRTAEGLGLDRVNELLFEHRGLIFGIQTLALVAVTLGLLSRRRLSGELTLAGGLLASTFLSTTGWFHYFALALPIVLAFITTVGPRARWLPALVLAQWVSDPPVPNLAHGVLFVVLLVWVLRRPPAGGRELLASLADRAVHADRRDERHA